MSRRAGTLTFDGRAPAKREGGHDEHILLDVWSTKQGALRLQTLPFAVILVGIIGLYLCVGAVLNYNAIDADQRDIITNMRVMLPGRMTSHQVSREKCKPESVGIYMGAAAFTASLDTVSKSRDELSDPRFLGYTEVLHPIIMLRKRKKGDYMDVIEWDYYATKFPALTLPEFRWDASLFLNITFKIDASDILQAAQLINAWPPDARPKLSYSLRANDNQLEVWTVMAAYGASLRVYKISPANGEGAVTVSHVTSILVETRYDAMDVPATFIQTNVAASDYNQGKPVIKHVSVGGQEVSCEDYFDLDARCRQTIYVPRIHHVSVEEYADIYQGKWSEAQAALSVPREVELSVTIRDLSQPRPYSPLFAGFGQPFFVGFGFLVGALLLFFLWLGLRFYVVNKHVRENEGKPPMFYQGMLRFRGW